MAIIRMPGKQVLILLALASLVNCYCPRVLVQNCSLRIQCFEDFKGFTFPEECQGSHNYPTSVNVTLINPQDINIDMNIDMNFLKSVTLFQIHGSLPQTTFKIVELMYNLVDLRLVNNQIERIEGKPFYILNHLENLNLSGNNLSDVGNLFDFDMKVNKLTRLALANNKIEFIPDHTFDQLTSLIVLDLSNNMISDLNNATFSRLTRLEVLNLSNNNIKNLGGSLNNLKILQHLYLRGNQIQNVDSLQIIYHLETLDISNNQMEELFPNVFYRDWHHFQSPLVCTIKMSDNALITIPNAFKTRSRHSMSIVNRLKNVQTELDLSNNSISNVEPYAFRSIAHLTKLDLSQNRLIDLIIDADSLKYVKVFNLSNNYISHLNPVTFSAMNSLINLDLSYNRLDVISEPTLLNNFVLRYLNMSHNAYADLKNFRIKTFHPEGGVLDLSNNGLSWLRIPRGEGLRLSVLILHTNNISDPSLIDLSFQKDLKVLDLSTNYIDMLNETSFHLPSNLVYLDLKYNQIQSIAPSTFQGLTYLQTLRLSRNLLMAIEYGAFEGLNSLVNLDLSYNNIQYLDSKVLVDLKSLRILSVRYNNMHTLEYNGWIGHRYNLRVNMDGNSFDCKWLAKALSDYHNGYSKMEPAASEAAVSGNALEGITCEQVEQLVDPNAMVVPGSTSQDERVLVLASKILEAIKEQTKILKEHSMK